MELYDRIITTDGYFATIKYIGNLPSHIWGSDTVALGIEWDDPSRGKHDGIIEGIKYFSTESQGSGSFIKSDSKKISSLRNTFVDAILNQYDSNVNFDQKIEFNTKVVESYGFEKLNNIQSNFTNLISISLDKKAIYKAYDDEKIFKTIMNSLANVEYLDLSYNLLNDFKTIDDIVDGIQSLKTLILNGNKFYKKIIEEVSQQHLLNSLYLASTNFTLDDLKTFAFPKFTNLTELSLANTRLTNEDFEGFQLNNTKLISIDLSFNSLLEIPLCFASSPIKRLNLSDNKIDCINGIYNNIRLLNLRNNRIDSWEVVNNLNDNFPNLSDLRMNGNPLFEAMTEDEAYFCTIARISCEESKDVEACHKLCKFNGGLILADDIKNADLYFISQVMQGKILYDKNCRRWKELMTLYNIETSLEPLPKLTGVFNSKKIMLHFKLPTEDFSRVFLRSNSILRVKGILARKLEVLFMHINLYYYINGENKDVNSKTYLDDLNIIDDYGFPSEQTIYISLNNSQDHN